MKNLDRKNNYSLQEIEQNEFMSIKHKSVWITLNYIEYFLTLASTITGCVSISAFASLLGIPAGSTSSAIGLKICTIGARSKKHDSLIKKNKKKHRKIVLLEKSKLDCIEVLISQALIDSVISNDELLLISNVLKEYNEI